MDARRGDAERKYQQHRGAIYPKVAAQVRKLHERGDATAINHRALVRWRETWVPLHGTREVGDWDWEALQKEYARKAKRLDVAIWAGDDLCGLVVGAATSTAVTLWYIEGWVASHPLQGYVIDIADIAATALALQIGLTKVRIMNPVPDRLEDYEALDYRVVKGCSPMVMEKGVPNNVEG